MNTNYEPYLDASLREIAKEISAQIKYEWDLRSWRNWGIDKAPVYDIELDTSAYNHGDFDTIGFGWSKARQCWFVLNYDHSDWGSLMLLYPKDLVGAVEEAWLRLGFDTYYGVKSIDWDEGGYDFDL